MACKVLKMALAVEPACLATLKRLVTTVSTKSKGGLNNKDWENEVKVEIYFVRGDLGRSSLLINGVGVKSINGVSVGLGKMGNGEFMKTERLSLSVSCRLCIRSNNGSDCVSVEIERERRKLD